MVATLEHPQTVDPTHLTIAGGTVDYAEKLGRSVRREIL